MSLSKSATVAALDASEIALLAFGVALVVGIVGESRSKRKVFEWLVILGVAGELIADGGIFVFSRSLQTLEGYEIARLTQEAANANERAKLLAIELSRVDESLRRNGARAPLFIAAHIGNNEQILRFRGQRVSILTCSGGFNEEERLNTGVTLWIALDPVWTVKNAFLDCSGQGLGIYISPQAGKKTRDAAGVLASVIRNALLLKSPPGVPVTVIRPRSKLPPEPDPDTIVVLVLSPLLR